MIGKFIYSHSMQTITIHCFNFNNNAARGDGYYHIYTREAYEIMEIRMKSQIISKQNSVDCLTCVSVFVLPLFPILCYLRQERVKELQKLQDIETVVKARKNATGPMSEIDLPEEVKDRFKERSRINPDTTGYAGGGGGCGYYVAPAYMCDAGGCGGGGKF